MILAFANFVVVLIVRNNQAEVKAELLREQHETREALIAMQNRTAGELAIHVNEDEIRFKHIDERHERIEAKLDRLLEREWT